MIEEWAVVPGDASVLDRGRVGGFDDLIVDTYADLSRETEENIFLWMGGVRSVEVDVSDDSGYKFS